MDKFVVPQFIDTEDKILGPLTARQFLIMLGDALIIFLLYSTLDFAAFIFFALVVFALGGTLAFFKVNGMPFHYFLLNLIQTIRRPGLRVWDKALSDTELKAIINEPPPPPPPVRIRKEPLAETRLSELSLVVNTGGVYNPDQE
jgi:hypothetical protein